MYFMVAGDAIERLRWPDEVRILDLPMLYTKLNCAYGNPRKWFVSVSGTKTCLVMPKLNDMSQVPA